MASLHASVRQLNGKVAVMDLRNPEQLQTIKKWLLENPGFVILTKATDVRAAWVGSVQDECSHDVSSRFPAIIDTSTRASTDQDKSMFVPSSVPSTHLANI